MDLLGDMGTQDQLSAARAEIKVLTEKVKELSGRVRVLTVENESLKAEVEIYRQEAAALGSNNNSDSANAPGSHDILGDDDAMSDLFVRAGQGVYPNTNEISWKNVHGSSNNLSVALSPDETVVASGGADKALRLVFAATASTEGTSARLELGAPVISVAFAATTTLKHMVACGCMDGSAYLVQYTIVNDGGRSVLKVANHCSLPKKHNKYVKTVAWSPKEALLATASADGTVNVYRVQKDGIDSITLVPKYNVQVAESLHLQTAIEALSFTADDQLLCYARNTAYIAAFDLAKDMVQTKINLNKAALSTTAGGFDDHVSMAVMDLKVSASSQHTCWLAATDTARNFVLDSRSQKIVRNLYGHANDGYSQPKAAWSYNGQYVLGNTQDESVVCVWDVASQQLVEKLEGHAAPIRDLDSSSSSDVLITTAFDKTTRVWYPSAQH